ncbi:MAG: hypothetical protein WAO58_02360 [Fimbriimonadaceae bacterium]
MAKIALIIGFLVALAIGAFLFWPKTPFDFLQGWDHLPRAPYIAGDVGVPANAAPDIYVVQGNWPETVDKATKELKERGYGFIQGAGSQAINFIDKARRQVSLLNDVRIVNEDGKNFNNREKGWITVQIHEKPWP